MPVDISMHPARCAGQQRDLELHTQVKQRSHSSATLPAGVHPAPGAAISVSTSKQLHKSMREAPLQESMRHSIRTPTHP